MVWFWITYQKDLDSSGCCRWSLESLSNAAMRFKGQARHNDPFRDQAEHYLYNPTGPLPFISRNRWVKMALRLPDREDHCRVDIIMYLRSLALPANLQLFTWPIESLRSSPRRGWPIAAQCAEWWAERWSPRCPAIGQLCRGLERLNWSGE